MLGVLLILFAFVAFMVGLQLYVRWNLLRARRSHLLHHRRRTLNNHPPLVFYNNNYINSTNNSVSAYGLDPTILNSLPVHILSSENRREPPVECPVCLSVVEEREKYCVLPTCNHSFHMECIGMWFYSNSTCPICRLTVEPVENNRSADDTVVVVSVVESEPGSSSGLCATSQNEEEERGERTTVEMVGVMIEETRKTESGDKLELSSPASQGCKSPATRLLVLKRSLSMNKRGLDAGTSCGYGDTELDIERGTAS